MNNSNETSENHDYQNLYGHFECPDCGRLTYDGDNIYDAGNGFCQVCFSDH